MFALHDASGEGTAGCCADTLEIYPKNGKNTSVKLDPIVSAVFGTTAEAHVSHTFELTTLPDGTKAALLIIKYYEQSLGGAPADALLALNLTAGSSQYKPIHTASGCSPQPMIGDVTKWFTTASVMSCR